MMTTIGILGAGGMGAALAERLTSNGARVVTLLNGRSESSRQRAVSAGMIDTGEAGLLDAEVVLSVVPPDQALPLAQQVAPILARARSKPVYVDCNAISPLLGETVEAAIAASGAPYADGGIIGLPPKPGNAGPTIYVSGPHAAQVARLSDFGVQMAVLDAPNGAASALKMSYAGITKGLIALATTMALAAERAGVSAALTNELRRSQPNLAASFAKSVPDMLGKARRWVPEMHEIAAFVGMTHPEAGAYEAFAGLYSSIASADDAIVAYLREVYLTDRPGD
jgi:3-hydroxyisobutyrate dehydrogenase-like beta-hydroxyacid dehydrogenase